MERDLLGRILQLAMQRKITIDEVLIYPLTSFPQTLLYIDGKMSKTTKITLRKKLEKSSVLKNPEMVDVVIVEVIFFVDLLPDLPETIGLISRSMLRKLFSFCQKN